MTLAAHCECPACKADLTNIPYSDSNGEIYKLNKFFISYFIKKTKFFICCLATIVLKIIFFKITFNRYVFLTILLLLMTLAESLFPERINSAMRWKYSDNYIDFVSGSFGKYFSCILALVSVFLW
jgi:general stress protein CsbA